MASSHEYFDLARVDEQRGLLPHARGLIGRLHEDLDDQITRDVHQRARTDPDMGYARQGQQASAVPIQETTQPNDLLSSLYCLRHRCLRVLAIG